MHYAYRCEVYNVRVRVLVLIFLVLLFFPYTSLIRLFVRSVIAQMAAFAQRRINARNYDFTLYFQQISLLPQVQRKLYEKLI